MTQLLIGVEADADLGALERQIEGDVRYLLKSKYGFRGVTVSAAEVGE